MNRHALKVTNGFSYLLQDGLKLNDHRCLLDARTAEAQCARRFDNEEGRALPLLGVSAASDVAGH